MYKIKDVEKSLKNCQNTLQKYFDDIVDDSKSNDEILKLREEYFKWIDMKTKFIDSEKNFVLPYTAIPNKINGYIYNYLYQDKKDIIDKYYKKDSAADEYIINVNKNSIPSNEAEILIHNLILRRGNVVWVNFGFNIGCEFGGKHPALILKNTKDTIIVLPLSSQTPNNPDINIEIDNVYGLPLKKRWGNILRIISVSVIRIDFNSPIGSIKNNILKEISEKIKTYGIK